MITRALLGAAAAAVVVVGVVTALPSRAAQTPPAAPAPAAAPAPVGAATEATAAPVAVRIPTLGVDSPLVALGVDAAGILVPPATADVAGWHAAGTVPGDIGPAVVAGHVDSRSGPGVFVDLATLRPGDAVHVEQADGEVATFTVRSVRTVDKAGFPTAEVYGPTPLPELRLITCGGYFDAADGHYRANVIVDAVLDGADAFTFRD